MSSLGSASDGPAGRRRFGVRRLRYTLRHVPVAVWIGLSTALVVIATCATLVSVSYVISRQLSGGFVDGEMQLLNATLHAGVQTLRDRAVASLWSFVDIIGASPRCAASPANETLVDFSDWHVPPMMARMLRGDPSINGYIYFLCPDVDRSYQFMFISAMGADWLWYQDYRMGRAMSMWPISDLAPIGNATPMTAAFDSPRNSPAWPFIQLLLQDPGSYGTSLPSPAYQNGIVFVTTGIATAGYAADGTTPAVHIVQFSLNDLSDLLGTLPSVTPNAVTVLVDSVGDVLSTSLRNVSTIVDLGGDVYRYRTMSEMDDPVLAAMQAVLLGWGGRAPIGGCVAGSGASTGPIESIRCDLRLVGALYLVDVITWRETDASTAYYVINLVPDADVTSEARRLRLVLLGISVAAFVVGVASIVLLVSMFLVPIYHCATLLNRLAMLEDVGADGVGGVGGVGGGWGGLMSREYNDMRVSVGRMKLSVDMIQAFSNRCITKGMLSGRMSSEPMMFGGIGDASPKEVTVMFIDVMDYTRNTIDYGAAVTLAALSDFFELLWPEMHADGVGAPVIDKFVGDAAMLVWGAPISTRANHALQAMRFAFNLIDKVNRRGLVKYILPDGSTADLRIKIGIATELGYAGLFGMKARMNWTVNGTASNLAARIESAANRLGYVIGVSDKTHELVSDRVICRRLLKAGLKSFGSEAVYEPICFEGGRDGEMVEEMTMVREMVNRWNEMLIRIDHVKTESRAARIGVGSRRACRIERIKRQLDVLAEYTVDYSSDRAAIALRTQWSAKLAELEQP